MAATDSSNASVPDVPFKPGDKVQVWSKSDSVWCSGRVVSVENGLVTAEYEKGSGGAKMFKSLPLGHEDIKWALGAAENEVLPIQSMPVIATTPPPLEKREDFECICLGASILSALSGMVNVVAMIELSSTVAHHTGNASHFGRLLGSDGFRFAALLVAYLVGAGAAGFASCDGDAVFAGRRSDGLLGAAGAVAAGAVLQGALGLRLLALSLWAFSQGLQNGVTSRFSGLALRTTHVTGALTDAGLILGQWAQAQYLGKPPPPLHKPGLFLLCVLSFAAGGFAANLLRKVLGVLAALAPAALLAALAAGHLTVAAILEALKTKPAVLKTNLEVLKKKAA